jgi:hypothetical protein
MIAGRFPGGMGGCMFQTAYEFAAASAVFFLKSFPAGSHPGSRTTANGSRGWMPR